MKKEKKMCREIYLTEQKVNEIQNLVRNYGEYRYNVDNGWAGKVVELDVKKIFFNCGLMICDCGNIYISEWGISIDECDFKICCSENKIYKIDVKCATKPWYKYITPKVNVEEKVPKDFYIATKIIEICNVVIDYISYKKIKYELIGYFTHNDITQYGHTHRYGAEYYEVPLAYARDISELLNICN